MSDWRPISHYPVRSVGREEEGGGKGVASERERASESERERERESDRASERAREREREREREKEREQLKELKEFSICAVITS